MTNKKLFISYIYRCVDTQKILIFRGGSTPSKFSHIRIFDVCDRIQHILPSVSYRKLILTTKNSS